MFSEFLSKIPGFSPKAILPMVTQNLANDIGFMPDYYRLIYRTKTETAAEDIFFEIKLPDGKYQKFLFPDGKNLIDAIKMQAGKLAGNDVEIKHVDAVVLIYSKDKKPDYVVELYYRNNQDEKVKLIKDL